MMHDALIAHVTNPFIPELGLRRHTAQGGLRLVDVLDDADWDLPPTTVLLRSGVTPDTLVGSKDDIRSLLVPRCEWDAIVLDAQIPVVFVTLPQGGGGASKVFRIVATIALAIAAASFGGPVGAFLSEQLGLGLSVNMATAIGTTIIAVSGQLLISALLPPPRSFSGGAAASPTYSLNAQGNRARLGEPVPELFGKHLLYPDLAAQPYSEYGNDDQQIIFELFCAGVGDVEVLKARIDTNVFYEAGAYTGTYDDIEIEIVPPGNEVTLFPDNVVTSTEVSSIELKGTDESGAGWAGPFPISAPGTMPTAIAIDIALPAGLINIDSSGDIHTATVIWETQAREIDDDGAATGAWVVIDELSITLSLAERDPIRRTYYAQLADYDLAGRVEVRVQRSNPKGGDAVSDTLYWVALKAYLPKVGNYGDRTMIAIRAAASANLNGTSAQKFNIIAQRKLELYDVGTETWSVRTATRSIAAAASYICKSSNALNKPDNQIDLATLWALDETWTTRGDNFDGIFDTRQSAWDALQSVLRCGRTKAIRLGKIITFVRDEPKSVPRAPFGPRTMLPGSFNIDYIYSQSNDSDALLVLFIDERTWTQNQILVKLPGSTATADTAPQTTVFGMTNIVQVWREYMYQLAASKYRRVFPNFRTELDGRVCVFGDLVKVSHWLPNWGSTADVLSLEEDDGGDILELSEPWSPEIDPDVPALLAEIATPDGHCYGPVEVAIVDNGETTRRARIQLLATATVTGKYAGQVPRDWPVWSGSGLNMERPRIAVGTGEEVAQDCLVTLMRPENGDTVIMNTVLEDARVHTADQTGAPDDGAIDTSAEEDLVVTAVTIKEARKAQNTKTQLGITISGAPDAVNFQYRVSWVSETDFSPARFCDRTFTLQSEQAGVTVMVRALGRYSTGAWFTSAPFTAHGDAPFGSGDLN